MNRSKLTIIAMVYTLLPLVLVVVPGTNVWATTSQQEEELCEPTLDDSCPPECPSGEYWDPTQQACVVPPPPPECPSGEYWDPTQQACVPPHPECRPDEFWDPTQQACVPGRPECPSGAYWDPTQQACVPYTGPISPCVDLPKPFGLFDDRVQAEWEERVHAWESAGFSIC